jgi:hypothetical protein
MGIDKLSLAKKAAHNKLELGLATIFAHKQHQQGAFAGSTPLCFTTTTIRNCNIVYE